MLIIAPYSTVLWMSVILNGLHCFNYGKMTGKFFASAAGHDGCLNGNGLLQLNHGPFDCFCNLKIHFLQQGQAALPNRLCNDGE